MSHRNLIALIMFVFISIMICGAVLGYFMRNKESISKVGNIIYIIVCLLLYMLGVSIGSNKLLIENFSTFCYQAAFIAFMSLTGSILASWLVFNKFFKAKLGK